MRHYRRLYIPEHPSASKQGHVYEHRVIAEKTIGRYLTKDEIVHHIDGDKYNNSPENLMVLSKYEHQRVHARENALEACGDASKMKCPYCKKYDDPSNMYQRKNMYQAWHRECSAAYKRVTNPKTGPYKYNSPPMTKKELNLNND